MRGFPPGKRVERAARAFAEPIAYLAQRKRLSAARTAAAPAVFAVPLVQGRQIRVRRQRVGLVSLEPQSGGQHGAHGRNTCSTISRIHAASFSCSGVRDRRFVERLRWASGGIRPHPRGSRAPRLPPVYCQSRTAREHRCRSAPVPAARPAHGKNIACRLHRSPHPERRHRFFRQGVTAFHFGRAMRL